MNEWNAPGPAVGTSRSSSSDGIDCAYLCKEVRHSKISKSMKKSTTTRKLAKERKKKEGRVDVRKEQAVGE